MVTTYSQSRWRNRCAPIVARILAQHKDAEEAAIREALYNAYPFGMRKYHPYRVWLDEISRQRGLKPKLGPRAREKAKPDPRQEALFADCGPGATVISKSE